MMYAYTARVEILPPSPPPPPRQRRTEREQVLIDARTGQVVYLLTRLRQRRS